MPFLTSKQIKEREVLAEAIKTVTKTEPAQWTSQIHSKMLQIQEDSKNIDEAVGRLTELLTYISVTTHTGGDNVSGWRSRTVYLTENQQKTILAWLRFSLELGGKVADYEDLN